MWGMLALTSFALADTFFISRLGTLPLAALGFCIPVIMFFMGVIFGLSVGTSSAVSRVYGSGDIEKAQRLSTDSLSLGVAIITAACVIGFFSTGHIFGLMGAGSELMPLISRYMTIWYVGLPFLGALMMGNACMRAMGDTRFVSFTMILLAVSNIVLDPFFIFGIGPFPEMGMAGATVTHVISNYMVCMISFYHLIYKNKIIKTDHIFHAGLVASWKRILHVAVPSIISNQIAPVSAAIITWMAAGFGKEAVAALGVASRIDSISTIIFYSTGAGVSIFTGQNFGAGNLGRIKEGVDTGSRYAIIWGLMVAAVLWVFAHQIPLLFDKNAAVAAWAGFLPPNVLTKYLVSSIALASSPMPLR